MYSTYNKAKCVVAERFIITLKKYIYTEKYTNKLDDIVNKYNNTYHNTIKKKSVNVKSNTHTDLVNKLIIKVLNSNLVVLLEY